jgi:hypothetical protein
MKIVCITNDNEYITIGKVYNSYSRSMASWVIPTRKFYEKLREETYLIRNDKGYEDVISKGYFLTLKEYRKLKLLKLVDTNEI